MGSPNSKKKVKKLSRQEQELQAARKAKYTKTFLMVFACIALVGVLAGVAVGVFMAIDAAKYNEFVTYESDLSEYVYLDPEIYKSFDVNMLVNIPDGDDVDRAVMKLLYNNRKKYTTDDFNGDGVTGDKYNSGNIKDQTIRLGDTANIFYRGYYLNDDGKKIYFDGGCNFASSTPKNDVPHALDIGAGGFVEGFEEGLIGKNMKDYATLERFSSNEVVVEDDVVYISYDYIFYNGTAKKGQYALIDLSDPEVDEVYGEGFRDLLVGAVAGVAIKESHMVNKTGEDGSTQTDSYSAIKVEKIIRVTETAERPVLEVEVQFPLDYTEELAGKTGWFEVYIMTTQLYDTPEFNEEFLTETLKVKAEDLAEYEGETLTEKYRAKLLAEELDAHEDKKYDASVSAMWEHYLKNVQVKKYPMGDVKSQYDGIMLEIESFYNYYKTSYGFSSLKDAAQFYLEGYYGVTEYTSWEDAVMEQAEDAVKRMMTLYYVMNEENFYLDDEAFAAAYKEEYDEAFESYLNGQGCTPDKYDTAEKYESAKAEHKKTFDNYYTEEYFNENVRYNHAVDEIVANFAKIVYPE